MAAITDKVEIEKRWQKALSSSRPVSWNPDKVTFHFDIQYLHLSDDQTLAEMHPGLYMRPPPPLDFYTNMPVADEKPLSAIERMLECTISDRTHFAKLKCEEDEEWTYRKPFMYKWMPGDEIKFAIPVRNVFMPMHYKVFSDAQNFSLPEYAMYKEPSSSVTKVGPFTFVKMNLLLSAPPTTRDNVTLESGPVSPPPAARATVADSMLPPRTPRKLMLPAQTLYYTPQKRFPVRPGTKDTALAAQGGGADQDVTAMWQLSITPASLFCEKPALASRILWLKTPHGPVRTCYADQDMRKMAKLQHKYALANCASSFSKLPTEVLIKIFKMVDCVGAFGQRECTGEACLPRSGPWMRKGLLEELALTSRHLYAEVTNWVYNYHQFYFQHPWALQSFLDSITSSHALPCRSKHFGTVILRFGDGANQHGQTHARTAIVAHNGDWDTAMSQFNAEVAERVRDDLYFRKRRNKLREYTRTRTKKQVVQDWQAPIRQLLICHTVGRLVLEGDSACKPALKAGSGIVAALLGFRGKGKVQSVWKAGEWPAGSDKLFAIVKTALEDGSGEDVVDTAPKPDLSVLRETRSMKRKLAEKLQ